MKYINYDCQKLGKQVVLNLSYAIIPGGFAETLTKFSCNKTCVECGVLNEDSLPKYNFNVCPAYNEYLK
jgi:hypothetical protein